MKKIQRVKLNNAINTIQTEETLCENIDAIDKKKVKSLHHNKATKRLINKVSKSMDFTVGNRFNENNSIGLTDKMIQDIMNRAISDKNNPKSKIVRSNKLFKAKTVEERLKENPIPKKKYRKLSDRSFKNLMKLAKTELGINDNDHSLYIQDLNQNDENDENKVARCFDELLAILKNNKKAYRLYLSLIKNRKDLSLFNKISVILYVQNQKFEKPFCVREANEKINIIRKGIKKAARTGINAFVHGIFTGLRRDIPDEEFMTECSNKKRTLFDDFDKLDLNTQIQWARHVVSFIGVDFKYNVFRTMPTDIDNKRILINAMKYACILCDIKFFKDRFIAPYWIFHRAMKYYAQRTKEESDAIIKVFELNQESSKLINIGEAVKLSINTLKSMKLMGKYKKALSANPSMYDKEKLKIAQKLIMDFCNG